MELKLKGFDRLMQRIESSFTVALIAQPLEILSCGIAIEQIIRDAQDKRYSRVVYRSREPDGNERLNVQEFRSVGVEAAWFIALTLTFLVGISATPWACIIPPTSGRAGRPGWPGRWSAGWSLGKCGSGER